MAAAAVLAGAWSFAAIAEWATDAPQPVRAALGGPEPLRTAGIHGHGNRFHKGSPSWFN